VKREAEVHRQILAFSISHDHTSVRIYGCNPLIDESKTTFYRHLIHKFDFTALEGREKWTAYKFTKNIYDVWMPTHFKRICSVIVFYLTYKFWTRAPFMPCRDMDVRTGMRELNLPELIAQEHAERAAWPRWKKAYIIVC
jgi:hypothetical protein